MAEPADRFEHGVSAVAALEHAIPHAAVPQLLRPVLAAVVPTRCIVVRTHADRLRCVGTATFTGTAPLTPADTQYLATFPYLGGLSLEGKDIDTASLALVAELTRLEHLNLICCDGVGAAGLAEVAKLTHVQQLDLSACSGVDAPGLAEVAKLTRLQHLDLSWCGNVSAAGLAEVAKLKLLQHLHLSGCDGVDAAGLADVAKLTRLQHLYLSGCSGVDAAGLAEVAKLTHLQHLNLSCCRGVDSAATRCTQMLQPDPSTAVACSCVALPKHEAEKENVNFQSSKSHRSGRRPLHAASRTRWCRSWRRRRLRPIGQRGDPVAADEEEQPMISVVVSF